MVFSLWLNPLVLGAADGSEEYGEHVQIQRSRFAHAYTYQDLPSDLLRSQNEVTGKVLVVGVSVSSCHRVEVWESNVSRAFATSKRGCALKGELMV